MRRLTQSTVRAVAPGIATKGFLTMSKKMLINAMHPEEARVAIVKDGRLVELDIETEGHEQTRGNVYKGVVVRVEQGLQAAFVDIGLKKLGFLQMGELHPDFWQWRDDIPEDQRKRRPRIQEVLRRGQELIVQVEKGERDMKGAALTTYLSLPGRYMVVMPGSDSTGISRKVESESERKKLKETVSKIEIPEGIGYIIRTEAVGKTKTELGKDFEYLVKLYESIKEKAGEAKGPTLIYQESDLVIRTIRDYFSAEIDEVLVDSKDVYKQARTFFRGIMPKYEKLVKLHKEKRPIFSKYQLEEQIDLIYEKKVPLKSGGSIVIEPTEALVSIDVNSGKSTGEKGVEDTAFRTNMEAAEEVARQLRLRDLGGLIVIDFIDMRDRKHINEVEKTLKTALKMDKARVNVGKISAFGMLEMSRQRIKQTINEGIYLECPHCEGRGKLKSVEAMALSFLRKVHAAAAKGTVAEVRGGLPLEVAYYLLNRKKRELAQIENDYEIDITIKGKPSFLMNQMELELTKRDKPLHFHVDTADAIEMEQEEELPPAQETAEEAGEAYGEEAAPQAEEGKAKRKRKRKKKPKAAGETATEAGASEVTEEEEETEAAAPETVTDETETAEEDQSATAETSEEAKAEPARKKRKRKRKRGAKTAAAGEAPAETAPLAPSAEEEEEVAGEEVEGDEQHGEEAHHGEGAKKKRRRKRRRGKRHTTETEGGETTLEAAEAAAVVVETVAEPAQPEIEQATPVIEETVKSMAAEELAQAPSAQPKKPAKPRAPRKKSTKKEAVAEETAAPPEAPSAPEAVEQVVATEETVPTKPAKKRTPRKTKASEPAVPAVAEPSSSEPATDAGEQPVGETPKKKRAPRRKKEAMEDQAEGGKGE